MPSPASLTMISASSSSCGGHGESPLQSGLAAASKILKSPDVFNGEDSHSFAQWGFASVRGFDLVTKVSKLAG